MRRRIGTSLGNSTVFFLDPVGSQMMTLMIAMFASPFNKAVVCFLAFRSVQPGAEINYILYAIRGIGLRCWLFSNVLFTRTCAQRRLAKLEKGCLVAG